MCGGHRSRMRAAVEREVDAGRPSRIQRTTSQPGARSASSRSFSSYTASPGSCPGCSSRPYLTLPSNSPRARCAATRSRRTPRRGKADGQLQVGAGRPARAIATRLRTRPRSRRARPRTPTTRVRPGRPATPWRGARAASSAARRPVSRGRRARRPATRGCRVQRYRMRVRRRPALASATATAALEPRSPGDVDDRPGRRRHDRPVDHDDVVRVQGRGVDVQPVVDVDRRSAGRTSRGPARAAGPTSEGRAPRPRTRDWPRRRGPSSANAAERAAHDQRRGRPVSRST